MRVFRIKDVVKPNGPVSRSTLYAHAAQGRITLRKIGGATVVTAPEWNAYVEGQPLIHRAAQAA